MNWFDIIKGKGISGGPPKDRKRKPSKRGRTTPSGSRQAKMEKLIDDLLSGKLTDEEYKSKKEALDKGE